MMPRCEMLRHGYGLLTILALLPFPLIWFGCGPGEVQADLGEEFSLSIGQSAVIAGEDLSIRFEEVVEDSRCPKGVQCVWEGRAVSTLEMTETGTSYQITLTESGLTEEYGRETYGEYQLSFRLEPYPVEGQEISGDAYRLLIVIDRQ